MLFLIIFILFLKFGFAQIDSSLIARIEPAYPPSQQQYYPGQQQQQYIPAQQQYIPAQQPSYTPAQQPSYGPAQQQYIPAQQQSSDNRQFIQRDSDLKCDFDSACRWRNGTNGVEDDFDWGISDQVVVDSWHSIPRGKDGPGDLFAYARGRDTYKESTALLISDPIACQSGDGNLTFYYWKTALIPVLRVCIRKPPGQSGHLTCVAHIHGLHRQEWIKETVKIPASKEPFEIVFDARFQHNFDTVGLDKIMYTANLCGQSGTVETREREEGTCPAVDCSFENNKLCDYKNGVLSSGRASPGALIKKWMLSNRQVSNSLTGIFADRTGKGSYAYAGNTVSQQDTFVLESPKFTVTSPSKLDFSYYLAGIEGRLRACLNSLSECRFESLGKDIKSDARRWRTGSLSMDPGTYSVLFLADNLDKNYVIGLDDIALRNTNGGYQPCTVQNTTTTTKEGGQKEKKEEG